MPTEPTNRKDDTETMEPVAPATTEPTDMNTESETKEPVAPVATDLTDPKAKPENEEPVAPVPLTPPSLFLHLHVFRTNLKADPDDSAG